MGLTHAFFPLDFFPIDLFFGFLHPQVLPMRRLIGSCELWSCCSDQLPRLANLDRARVIGQLRGAVPDKT